MPSRRLPSHLIVATCLPGLASASYLTYAKVFDKAVACATGGCEVIQSSSWSELAGVPITLLGVIAYLLLAATAYARSERVLLGAAALAYVGMLYSFWLQYQALAVIRHLCPYCLTSAACMVVLAGLTTFRLLRAEPSPDPRVEA